MNNMALKLMTMNVRLWTRDRDKSQPTYWKTRMKNMKEMLEEESPDVICFQELMFPASCYIPKGYRRVCPSVHHPVYVRKGLETRAHRYRKRFDKVELPGENITLVNVHSTWEKDKFSKDMDAINSIIRDAVAEGRWAMVCGDFNNTMQTVNQSIKGVARVPQIASSAYTYRNYETGSTAIIDHFYTDLPVSSKVHRVTGFGELSDHVPLYLSF